MSELHITKVSNGYIVKTLSLFGKDPRVFEPTESWVFPTLGALNAWMKKQFALEQSDE